MSGSLFIGARSDLLWPRPPGSELDQERQHADTKHHTTAQQKIAELQARCMLQSSELAEQRTAYAELERTAHITPGSHVISSMDQGEQRRMAMEIEGLHGQVEALMRQVQDLLEELRVRPTKEEHAAVQLELKKARAELQVRPQLEEVIALKEAVESSNHHLKQSEMSVEALEADLAEVRGSLSEARARELGSDSRLLAETTKWSSEVAAAHAAQAQLRDELRRLNDELTSSAAEAEKASVRVQEAETGARAWQMVARSLVAKSGANIQTGTPGRISSAGSASHDDLLDLIEQPPPRLLREARASCVQAVLGELVPQGGLPECAQKEDASSLSSGRWSSCRPHECLASSSQAPHDGIEKPLARCGKAKEQPPQSKMMPPNLHAHPELPPQSAHTEEQQEKEPSEKAQPQIQQQTMRQMQQQMSGQVAVMTARDHRRQPKQQQQQQQQQQHEQEQVQGQMQHHVIQRQLQQSASQQFLARAPPLSPAQSPLTARRSLAVRQIAASPYPCCRPMRSNSPVHVIATRCPTPQYRQQPEGRVSPWSHGYQHAGAVLGLAKAAPMMRPQQGECRIGVPRVASSYGGCAFKPVD